MRPRPIRIVEVGPRDGLQNEALPIPSDRKAEFIRLLAEAGLRDIEATSFVHPRWVPQLADAAEVLALLPPLPGVVLSALVPNLQGLERALACGVGRVAVFTAASETFSQKNTNRSVARSLEDFRPVLARAAEAGVTVRGYVSTCWVCPYEGPVSPDRVLAVTEGLLELGVDEVSLGDTVGQAVPREVARTLDVLLARVPAGRLALHLHDTCGTALANVQVGLEKGLSTFDSSAGGLGGCPYAPGAAGNLATEDLVWFLERQGFSTGVSVEGVLAAARAVTALLGRVPGSHQALRSGGS